MANNPIFANNPRISATNINTANTNTDGTGSISMLIAGASTGTKVYEIIIKSKGTTTAGQVRLFLHDGTNFFFFDEIPVNAMTVSAGVSSIRVSMNYNNLTLPNNSWSIYASTYNSESIDVIALGADL